MGAAVHVGSAAAAAQAQQRQTSFPGKSLFSTYCASCHGATAKGDGPFAASLRKRPSDLTQLAKLNAGTFPAEAVAKSIDGREMAVAHGADMPVWGDAFSRTREDSDPESVRLKIKSIVQYIESLQERPVTHE
jgi:mono/diheme cytochrome c family protein